jgi:hypothetical protein
MGELTCKSQAGRIILKFILRKLAKQFDLIHLVRNWDQRRIPVKKITGHIKSRQFFNWLSNLQTSEEGPRVKKIS